MCDSFAARPVPGRVRGPGPPAYVHAGPRSVGGTLPSLAVRRDAFAAAQVADFGATALYFGFFCFLPWAFCPPAGWPP